MTGPLEIAWFGALCDDDAEHLGVPAPALASSYAHCKDIVLRAERGGFDNILLPSSYTPGIDSVAFAGGVAPLLDRMSLLVAVRCAELWPPMLARQLATLDHMLGGRLTVNVISSDLAGAPLPSAPRYRRSVEVMQILRRLLDGEPVEHHGEFYDLEIDPPRLGTVSGRCPPFYFGGFSEDAREAAAREADVFLMWPDRMEAVKETLADMRRRAAAHGRRLRFGYRVHVIVRETESEARAAARNLVSALDDAVGDAIRRRSLDHASAGVARQAEVRAAADAEGYVEDHLWTGIGRARSGCGAALVGDPDQVRAKLLAYAELGLDAFILSGYPHAGECDRFARLVLPDLPHAPLLAQWPSP
ncbi:MAG: LLM class flavin-dependent oxidoreductase [Myxococcota bacterium]|nr:LLM class flavin-dependent oxidoreductase [Myxococcota bacterium]